MAKAVADTDSVSNQGGFTYDSSKVTGFSSMHDSGTGGQPSLGNFALFPYPSCPNDDISNCKYPKRDRAIPYDMSSVVARPGHFGIKLSNGVEANMTTTHHASLFRFRFANFTTDGPKPLILLDLTDLSDSRQDNASITVDPLIGRMTGGGRFLPSFGEGAYDAFFCADFNGATIAETGIFVNSRPTTQVNQLSISRSINGYPLPGGGFIRFSGLDSTLAVNVRLGVSLISADKACLNAENEIPDFNYDTVRSAAEDLWRGKLQSVTVNDTGVNSTYKTMFYRYAARALHSSLTTAQQHIPHYAQSAGLHG
jgi:putative alpha-1,2-mannosidase